MKTQKVDDFVVETNGHCFFCLTKVTNSQCPGVKVEHSTSTQSININSLQCLSKYLNVDMRKVFNEKDYVPPHLLAKVENARLKVELCGDCSHLTESFSKLYRTLEKVEMGMASFANQIQRILEDADQTGKAEQFLVNTPSESNLASGLKGKMEVMKVLRKEVVEKCANKLGTVQPTVKVKRMTVEQIKSKRKRLKIKFESQDASTKTWEQVEAASQSFSEPGITVGHPKIEETYPDPFQDDGNDFGNDYADDYEIPDEHQDSNQTYDEPETTVTPTPSRSGMAGQGSLNTPQDFQCIFNPETGKYKCKLCEKELGSKTARRTHYNNIHAKIKYKCNLCGKELSQLSVYHRHLRTVHLGVRFKCQSCSKQFTQKCELTAHLKVSTSCGTGQDLNN